MAGWAWGPAQSLAWRVSVVEDWCAMGMAWAGSWSFTELLTGATTYGCHDLT